MRWIWIDKCLEFESGKRAVSLKNVTLAEEHLHDHFPGFPIMPECLMIEAMAQTVGILVGEHLDFQPPGGKQLHGDDIVAAANAVTLP